ncbi:MAG TPA: hypothetical protein VEA81_02975 [Burkholderiaceae bacterium]|nr:hypothetical protein [Burkholderiaceae bacterium]
MDRLPDTRRRRALGALAAWPALAGAGTLAATLGGCASGPPPIMPPAGADPLPPVSPAAGDRWRYRLVDRYNGASIGEAAVEVASASPELALRIDAGERRGVLEERYVDPWTAVVESVFDGPVAYETPVPLVPPGLRTGASVRTVTRWRSPFAPFPLAWQQTVTARRWERVTVPAGTFDALRVERLIWFQHPDPFRNASERTDILWYAPEAGRWVRREWTGDYLPTGGIGRGQRMREDWVIWELVARDRAGR